MIHSFITLAELAEAAGRDAADAGEFFTEIINDPHSLFTPYMMLDGKAVPVSREELASDYYWNQGDVRVTKDDTDDYIHAAAMAAAVHPADDQDMPNGCTLETKLARIAGIMAAWLADPATGLGDDIDEDIDNYFRTTIDNEGETPKC